MSKYAKMQRNMQNMQNTCLQVFICNAKNMPKYEIKNMQEICKYMQKYANGNRHKYAKICKRKYA